MLNKDFKSIGFCLSACGYLAKLTYACAVVRLLNYPTAAIKGLRACCPFVTASSALRTNLRLLDSGFPPVQSEIASFISLSLHSQRRPSKVFIFVACSSQPPNIPHSKPSFCSLSAVALKFATLGIFPRQ